MANLNQRKPIRRFRMRRPSALHAVRESLINIAEFSAYDPAQLRGVLMNLCADDDFWDDLVAYQRIGRERDGMREKISLANNPKGAR